MHRNCEFYEKKNKFFLFKLYAESKNAIKLVIDISLLPDSSIYHSGLWTMNYEDLEPKLVAKFHKAVLEM